MKVGVDLTQIKRFAHKETLMRRLLTDEELIKYEATDDKPAYLAVRWAAKEAIFKATGDRAYLKYSVLSDDGGYFVKDRPDIELSVAADGEYAIAVATAGKKN